MTICALCSNSLPKYPIVGEDHSFCCMGCHAVFSILATKSQLENYKEHPLFQQAVRSGLISNPNLLEQIQSQRININPIELEKIHLEISEMWCPSCAEVIKLVLLQTKGVDKCIVDYTTDLAVIEYSPRHISKDKIYDIIQSMGYIPSALDNLIEKKASSFSLYLRFIVALFCSLNIMMFSYPIYASYFDSDNHGYAMLFAWLSLGASLPILGYSAWPIFRRFKLSLQAKQFGMETLVLIGVCAAFGLSVYEMLKGSPRVFFDSMSAIIVFVLLGKIMENKAKFTAKNLLFRLHRSIPRRGRKRLEDGSYQFVPIKDLGIGDTIVSFTGEKLIVDGIVIEGEGACEESLVTGESIPISKSLGSRVIGGSLLQSGWLACRMTASAEESALHKIISMVEQQIDHKASYVRLADRIVRWFVPVVVAIAIITGISCMIFGVMDASQTITETAWMRAIAILLISCPCAIGIAAPLAESNLINSLAQLGVLVRNRGCLSLLGRETVIVFDKTGTVTEGQFRLLAGLEHLSEEKLRVLKGIASQSLHPIAHAIAKAIEGVPMQFDKIEEFAGNGLRGVIGEHIYCLGSSEFFKQLGIALPERFASTHKGIISEVFFAINGVFITKLELGDRIREGIKELLKALSPAKTILLSGDSALSVEQVAKECGFHEWKSQSTPLHKRDFVDQLRHQGEIVCMIGDGINDAPALTGANIGISVVSASDISIQVSDLLLTTDKLAVLPKIRSLAKKGQHITKQNLFWAFFYNVIGIGLAAFGVLSPIFSAFAMVTSSLIVLFNAKRINGAVLR